MSIAVTSWFESNPDLSGKAPLVELRGLASALILEAERQGRLGPGKEIVAPASSSSVVVLAFVAATLGYATTLVTPGPMSYDRRKLVRACGAKLVLTDAGLGMHGAVTAAETIAKAGLGHYVLLRELAGTSTTGLRHD